MWSVTRIDEADYGCEERMPGEPLLVLVTIESDDGRMCRFECAENWLLQQGIDEGDEWPEDIEQVEADREAWRCDAGICKDCIDICTISGTGSGIRRLF